MTQRFISADELKKAIRIKAEFMDNISHDLRTPLNIIIGFSELMLDEVPGPINANQRQCLNDILSSSKRLLDLINSIVDPAKIDKNDCQGADGKDIP